MTYYYTWAKQRGFSPLDVERAEEDEFILADGCRVYDFISTSFQASFGHSNQFIRDRIARQLDSLSIAPPKANFELKTQVSESLVDLVDRGGGKIFYTVSGAEAVENAIKMARRITGRSIILSRQKSYHGASLGAMSVSGDWRSSEHLNFTEGTRRIPEPDDDPNAEGVAEVIAEVGPEKIAAILVETISGTNGVYLPTASWLAGLRRLCDQHEIFLILDEVLVGFYRAGAPFAFQLFNGQPDMVCMSKAITGGYIPLGAVWTNPKIAEFYDEHVLVGGLTNYAHPLGLAATAGVLEQTEQTSFRDKLNELQKAFQEGVELLASRHHASAIRQIGMIAAIEFGERTLPTANDFLNAGLHLYTKANLMILAPPLTTNLDRMQAAFQRASSALI